MSIPAQVPPMNRRDLNKLQVTPIHRARNWSKADVSLVEWPANSGQQFVIKDFARRPLWFRFLIGRLLLRREWRTLRTLHDVTEVPVAHHQIDADAFLMDYCRGQQISGVEETQMPDGLTAHIENLVKTIHARGVTHGDLHSSNILVNNQDCGFALTDWATACYFGPNPRGWRKVLFSELSALDDRAMAKLKVTYHPTSLTPRQRDLLLNGGSALYRAFKKLRHFLEKLRGLDKSAHRASIVKSYKDRMEQPGETQSPTGKNQDQQI